MDTSLEAGSSSKARHLELHLIKEAGHSYWWPQFEAALKDSRELLVDSFTNEAILAAIVGSRIQMWVVSAETAEVFILSQFYQTETTTVFQIFWTYGENFQKYLPLLADGFDQFARHHGATKIEIQGRKGFERLIKPYGYELDYVTYSRRVQPAQKEN